MRKINDAIKSQADISTRYEDCSSIVDRISSCSRFLTSVDMTKCFWGITLSEKVKSSGLANLLTPVGVFRCERAMTGFCKTPKFLEEYLEPYLITNNNDEYSPLNSDIHCFVDDLNLASPEAMDRKEHLCDTASMLERIIRSGLKINLNKSKFCVDLKKEEIRVLGFMVSSKRIRPDPEKIKGLMEFEKPTRLVGLQRFLGSIIFFRHCLNLSISGSINVLNSFSSAKTFDSNNELFIHHFEKIKEEICKLAIYKPQPSSVNILYTDASAVAYGAALLNVTADPSVLKKRHTFKINRKCGPITEKAAKMVAKHAQLGLKMIQECDSVFECGEEVSKWNDKEFKPNELKSIIYTKVYRNARLYELMLPMEEEKKREFFAELYLDNQQGKQPFKEDPEKMIWLENMEILELSKLLRRQFLILNDKSYTRVGQPSLKPPIILLYEEKKIVWFEATIAADGISVTERKSMEDLSEVEIANLLKGILKRPEKNELQVRPVGFLSKKFNSAQVKYPIYLKELLAICSSLKEFRFDVNSTRTIVLTDNLPSVQLVDSKRLTTTTVNLLTELSQEFGDVKVVYTPAATNIADCLSRPEISSDEISFSKLHIPRIDNDKTFIFNSYDQYLRYFENNDTNQINNLRQESSKLQDYYESRLNNEEIRKESRHLKIDNERFEDRGGLFIEKDNGKLLIPESLEDLTISRCHLETDHAGAQKMLDALTARYEFENETRVRRKIKEFGNNCVGCILNLPSKTPYIRGEIYPEPKEYGEIISADLMEFHQSDNKSMETLKSSKCLIIIEHFSGKISGYLLGKADEADIIRCFVNYFSENYIPRKLLSDNGSIFRGHQFKSFLNKMGIALQDSAAFHSSSRGRVERSIGRLRHCIRNTKIKFPHLSPQVLLSVTIPMVNNTPFLNNLDITPSIKKEVSQYGKLPYMSNHNTHEENKKIRKSVNTFLKKIFNQERKIKEKRLKQFNKSKSKHNYEIGDIVIIKRHFVQEKNLSVYHPDLYKVIASYPHCLKLERLLDNFVTLRHPTQIKLITKDEITNETTQVDEFLKNKCELPQYEKSLLFDVSKLGSQRVMTRNETKKREKLIQDDLLEERKDMSERRRQEELLEAIEDDEDEESVPKMMKKVTFA